MLEISQISTGWPGENTKKCVRLTDDSSSSSEEEPTEVSTTSDGKRKKEKKPVPIWRNVAENESLKIFPTVSNNNEEPILQGPIDYFKYFFDSDLVNTIVTESNIYSVQKNASKPLNTYFDKEIEQFIGICVYMSTVYMVYQEVECFGMQISG